MKIKTFYDGSLEIQKGRKTLYLKHDDVQKLYKTLKRFLR